ncbi:hypothetical protein QJS04_geneDACA010324 [Acorus gramineus]|uniref:DUF8040 domain-containing protein n=1 Tax=Acorus gramineus TaxID=55184 RepID=A0AAV9A4T1_ACOGR|nr:hypothetical protein QJS04_geneDACA018356 [Acorus gramineus]KAK1259159.1 hypothetical protein QJS04_geneDACA010324 [Acorus gramineus]
MDQHVFIRLADFFRKEGWLEDTRNMIIEEQLAIFLTIVGHNTTNRYCQDRFQHSGETISRQFRAVLSACLKLSKLVIHSPDFSRTPNQIRASHRFFPAFKVTKISLMNVV